MTVGELKDALDGVNLMKPVMIAFDSGIRMDLEVVGRTTALDEDIEIGTIVLSDESDFEAASSYHEMERL